jgi:hypothetical protein
MSDDTTVTRRSVLNAAGGAVGLFGSGTSQREDGEAGQPGDCSETTLEPNIVRYDDSVSTVCADDHPTTQRLHRAVQESLNDRFPTVGSLIDDGFVPYFDFLSANEAAGWSHWLNPEYLGDDSVVDPERPASVLVDHKYWRPIGMMFVATRDGERLDPEPVYRDEDNGEACRPWHAHVGLPGLYSWFKYRALSVGSVEGVPCRTPWMMHMWAYPHPESLYAHHAPPRGSRGGPPAEDPGFETDAVPGEDRLGPEVLPDAFRARIKRPL